jgi:hypothetical protein
VLGLCSNGLAEQSGFARLPCSGVWVCGTGWNRALAKGHSPAAAAAGRLEHDMSASAPKHSFELARSATPYMCVRVDLALTLNPTPPCTPHPIHPPPVSREVRPGVWRVVWLVKAAPQEGVGLSGGWAGFSKDQVGRQARARARGGGHGWMCVHASAPMCMCVYLGARAPVYGEGGKR